MRIARSLLMSSLVRFNRISNCFSFLLDVFIRFMAIADTNNPIEQYREKKNGAMTWISLNDNDSINIEFEISSDNRQTKQKADWLGKKNVIVMMWNLLFVFGVLVHNTRKSWHSSNTLSVVNVLERGCDCNTFAGGKKVVIMIRLWNFIVRGTEQKTKFASLLLLS